MLYERISKSEIDLMTRKDGFTPNYTYEDFIYKTDSYGNVTEEFYINLTIHMSADQVYEEWINQQNNPPQQEQEPDQNVILLEKVTVLEEKVATLENTVNSLVAADEPQF